jgi:aldose 1-epimerase
MNQSADTPQDVELRRGALRLALRPDLGGCVAGFWHDGRPVLRSVEPRDLAGPRPSGCFPLVPYSNRIAHGRFEWHGRRHETRVNVEGSRHSIHGVGWMRPWRVVSRTEREACLSLAHEGDEHWPFAFDAAQRFFIDEDALNCELSITSRAEGVAPAGLGWHPYFPKRARSRLHLEAQARWDNDADNLPARRVVQHAIDADVAHLAHDNCFEGWTGVARIRDETLAVTLTSSLPHVVVFTPQDRDFFCVEPVSHVSNALNAPQPLALGVRPLARGECWVASMRIAVADVHR